MLHNSLNIKIINLAFWLGMLLLYILFPTQTHSVDAWGYAGDIKFGRNLFYPHHLLYNAAGFTVKNILNAFGFFPDVMRLLVLINGIVAWLAMIILYNIVRWFKHSQLKSLALVSVAAFSFGIWRFTVENETYILPVFFSLFASYFFICFYKTRNRVNFRLYIYVFLSGFFAAIACLFHQIHVFWWLGLWFGMFYMSFRQNIRFWLIFTLPVLLVPITYICVLYFYLNQDITLINLWQFIMQDVYSGAVGGKLGIKHLVLGFINLFRSFIQLHGSFLYLLKHSLLYIIPAFIALLALAYAFIILWRNRLKVKVNSKIIFITHLVIFVLQWLFAAYNVGNAEFMVMLPVLLVIMLATENPVPAKGLAAIAATLLIWNFSYGIWPNYKYRFAADEEIALIVNSDSVSRFVLVERGIVATKIQYLEGRLPENTLANPAYYTSRPDKNIDLKTKLDSLLQQNINVYTDCTGRPELLNRAALLDNETDRNFFKSYKLNPFDSFPTIAGKHILYKIEEKNKLYNKMPETGVSP